VEHRVKNCIIVFDGNLSQQARRRLYRQGCRFILKGALQVAEPMPGDVFELHSRVWLGAPRPSTDAPVVVPLSYRPSDPSETQAWRRLSRPTSDQRDLHHRRPEILTSSKTGPLYRAFQPRHSRWVCSVVPQWGFRRPGPKDHQSPSAAPTQLGNSPRHSIRELQDFAPPFVRTLDGLTKKKERLFEAPA